MNYQHFIDGTWQSGGATAPVTNPATGEQLATVPMADAAIIDRAVCAAAQAAKEWPRRSTADVVHVLARAATWLVQQGDAVARAIVVEQGKTLREAHDEIARTIHVLLNPPQTAQNNSLAMPGQMSYSAARPVGVVAVMTPWSLPLLAPTRLVAAALLLGNAVVLKPSLHTPGIAGWLADILVQAGLPPGVMNIVHGDDTTGAALASHAGVGAVACMGGPSSVRALTLLVAERGGQLFHEKGGSSTAIVLDDADLDRAVEGVMVGAFAGAGQRMLATRRLVTVHPIADALLERLVERAKQMRLGDGLHPEHDMGPLIGAEQQARVLSAIETACSEGAELLAGGHALAQPGFFVQPTILDRVRMEHSLVQMGVFGPVLSVLRADTTDEALDLANALTNTPLVELYTRDAGRIFNAIDRLRAPTVVINRQGLADDVPDTHAYQRLVTTFTTPRRVHIDYTFHL